MLNDLAKSLFGTSGGSSRAGVTMIYGIAVEDSENGEVLIQIGDEIIATGYEEEDEEMLEVGIEEDDDSIDAIEEDAEEEEPGESDDAEDFAEDETNEDDSVEDATEEPDDSEGV